MYVDTLYTLVGQSSAESEQHVSGDHCVGGHHCVSGDHCVSGFGASLNGEGVSAAGRREAEFRAGIRVR